MCGTRQLPYLSQKLGSDRVHHFFVIVGVAEKLSYPFRSAVNRRRRRLRASVMRPISTELRRVSPWRQYLWSRPIGPGTKSSDKKQAPPLQRILPKIVAGVYSPERWTVNSFRDSRRGLLFSHMHSLHRALPYLVCNRLSPAERRCAHRCRTVTLH